jgi:transcription elongation factor Elf1
MSLSLKKLHRKVKCTGCKKEIDKGVYVAKLNIDKKGMMSYHICGGCLHYYAVKVDESNYIY